MAKPKQQQFAGTEQRGFIARIGGRASFVVVSFGLVFAAYQVQGWKMPRALAVALIGLLLAAGAVVMLSILWEVVKEAKRWRDDREVSTAWIDKEPPGLLDYQPDMKRSNRKFVRQMNKLSRDTQKVGKRMARAGRVAKLAKLLGPRAAQIWGNYTAKGIFRSAAFIEKRAGHLRATMAEFDRAQAGSLASLPPPTNDEERAALDGTRTAFVIRSESTAGAITATEGYRDVVRESARQNYSRRLRVSSNRLADQLDEMIAVLRRSLKESQRLQALCEQKARS